MNLQDAYHAELGRMDYDEAYELQVNLQKAQIAGALGPVVLTVEHPPTITIGRRGDSQEVVAPEAVLKARGVVIRETDRGGQVTYHGPGQIVCYPLVYVEKLGLHEYMRLMEEAVIRTIAQWDLNGYRVEGRTGVWVGKEKICAMGIRVRKWWTLHGLALNVTTDLNHFGLIIPCGIRDRGVASMQKLLGPACPSMEEVRSVLLAQLAELLSLRLRETTPDSLRELATPAENA
jgi:lipoate-protein ligase B